MSVTSNFTEIIQRRAMFRPTTFWITPPTERRKWLFFVEVTRHLAEYQLDANRASLVYTVEGVRDGLPWSPWRPGCCRLCRQPTACAASCSRLSRCVGSCTRAERTLAATHTTTTTSNQVFSQCINGVSFLSRLRLSLDGRSELTSH